MSGQMLSFGAVRTRSPAIAVILKQAQEKIDIAAEKGDVNEVARLTALYTKGPMDYFIERPVDVEGDANRFCFTNRVTGFAVVDQELNLTADDLLEALTMMEEEVLKFDTPQALKDWVTGEHNNSKQWTLAYLSWLDYNRIILMTPWGTEPGTTFANWVRDFGFEQADYSYGYDNWFVDPWVTGYLHFNDQCMMSADPVPYFSFDNVVKWIDNVPCARLLPSYSGQTTGNGLVMESKTYKEQVRIPQPFMVEINKQVIRNKEIILIKEDVGGSLVDTPFDMGEDATVAFYVDLPPTPNFQTYSMPRQFWVYQVVDGVETDLVVGFQVGYTVIADQKRLAFELMTANISGNSTTVTFKLKDTYYPDIDSNQLSDVLCYIEESPVPYGAEWNGSHYSVTLPDTHATSPFVLNITAGMERRMMTTPLITPTGSPS